MKQAEFLHEHSGVPYLIEEIADLAQELEDNQYLKKRAEQFDEALHNLIVELEFIGFEIG